MKSTTVSDLSKNEQKVLYYLVRYPKLSDREIYNKIEMKQSTYSTIKKKLRKEGYFYSAYIPVFQHLGCELVVVWYVTLNRKTKTEDRLSITRETLLNASEIFTLVSESNQAILLSVSKNIADHVKVSDRIVQLYEENDFLEDIHYVLFPYDVSSIFSFFNFAPLLNRIFNLEPAGFRFGDLSFHEKVKCRVKKTQMSELEKRVYLGLVRYPEASDSVLSEKIGCSRQVLTRMKTRFMEEQLITKRRIVSLERLGFNILAMTHSKFNPLEPLPIRLKCVRNISTFRTPIFNIARDPESIMITAFRDFEEFKMLHNEFVTFCAKNDSLRGEPKTILLSIPRIFEVKWLVFEPLVKRILDDL
jgi:DNA-binding MarR family transcriptional regulator